MELVFITGIISIFAAIIGAGVGAIVNHLYRDFKDRPVIDITIESIYRARAPIRLPQNIYRSVKIQGAFIQWLDEVTAWDVKSTFDENRFTINQLMELRHLTPQAITLFEANLADIEDLLTSVKVPENEHQLRVALARVRTYWLNAFREDIFIAYSEAPNDVSKRVLENIRGDKEQTAYQISALKQLNEWLNRGLGPDSLPQYRIEAQTLPPDNPQKPYIFIEVLVRNSGRTETLLRDRASLLITDDVEIDLRGILERYGFDVYPDRYYPIKSHSIQQLVFSQDPDKTNRSELQQLEEIFANRDHSGKIVLEDYTGKKYTANKIIVKEMLPD